MSNVPGMIEAWAQRAECSDEQQQSDFFIDHITHTGCLGDTTIEHYGLEVHEHTWPDEVDGTPTYELMWNFLSSFTNKMLP